MKIRHGFVSNSSSSSFVIAREHLTPFQLLLIERHGNKLTELEILAAGLAAPEGLDLHSLPWEEDDEYGGSWQIEVNDECVVGTTGMDNYSILPFLLAIGVKAEHIQAYHSVFDRGTGNFARWGKEFEDDPAMAPGPEILDIEIATACDGVPGPNGSTAAPCRFCYKANKRTGEVMTLDTFKTLFARLPSTTTQIAFGLTNLYGPSAEHIWGIFRHARDNGVIPNVTINGYGLTDEIADRLASLMGAVAVSRYNPKDTCYDAVKALTDRGMSQCNIHQLVSEDTYDDCMELLQDMQSDPRLAKLNAVVFLMLKPKGRGKALGQMRDKARYKTLVDFALDRGLRVGFDSCSVPSFLSVVQGRPQYEAFEQCTDRCESGLFSLYIDVKGRAWPCSFGQDRHDLEPINVLGVEDFIRDVWHSVELDGWRKRLQGNCRSCPLYDIDVEG